MSKNSASGLNVGDKVSNFKAKDLHGNDFDLENELKNGPLVVIFYRGQWCPFCNKHLKKLEQNLSKIFEKGANVVAISPETSEFLKKTAQKTEATFRLLHDHNYSISELFDVTIIPGTLERFMVNAMLGAKLKKANTDDSQRLPIPATFIINQDKQIVWRHFNPDYKKRAEISDIVANLPEKK